MEKSWRGNWPELASSQQPTDAPVVGVDAEPGHQSAAIVAAPVSEGEVLCEVIEAGLARIGQTGCSS